MSTFTPEIDQRNNWFYVLLPSDTRTKVWDILHDCQKHIIDIDGEGPTGISVRSNPGYPVEEALAILVAATHSALHPDLLEFVTIGSAEDHMEVVRNEMLLNGLSVSVKYFEEHLGKIVYKRINVVLNNEIHKIRMITSGINLAETYKAKTRLDFSLNELHQLLDKRKRQKTISEAIARLETLHRKVETSNKVILSYHQLSKTQAQNYLDKLSFSPLEEGQRLSDVINNMVKILSSIEVLHEGFDLDEVKELNKIIAANTPPAPPAAK